MCLWALLKSWWSITLISSYSLQTFWFLSWFHMKVCSDKNCFTCLRLNQESYYLIKSTILSLKPHWLLKGKGWRFLWRFASLNVVDCRTAKGAVCKYLDFKVSHESYFSSCYFDFRMANDVKHLGEILDVGFRCMWQRCLEIKLITALSGFH